MVTTNALIDTRLAYTTEERTAIERSAIRAGLSMPLQAQGRVMALKGGVAVAGGREIRRVGTAASGDGFVGPCVW